MCCCSSNYHHPVSVNCTKIGGEHIFRLLSEINHVIFGWDAWPDRQCQMTWNCSRQTDGLLWGKQYPNQGLRTSMSSTWHGCTIKQWKINYNQYLVELSDGALHENRVSEVAKTFLICCPNISVGVGRHLLMEIYLTGLSADRTNLQGLIYFK